MKLWTVPVFGSGVFFLIAVAAGHVWTTALLRTGVSAVVLTIVALVVEGAEVGGRGGSFDHRPAVRAR
ncbi:hypothetical protein [Kyrpidia spormannii]|uniref:Uncharacterized protein n=1 Tax=Kyrpidia spormannii TaxID=2055160 RepID=A0ACA8Z927_9BACL|nr:hypothetical protein [Kyrpidia spormannii]CAB3392468.1 protein of unknown function [Kyrpidia spormannii]